MQNKSQPTTQTQNQNTPKIRFKNFSDEWVEKKFGEIFKYERPDRFIVKNDEYDEKANTPVLTANKAFILGYTNENNTYNKESIIFDDFTLDCKYVDFPYMVKSSAIKILTIKNKEENNLKFAFESLNSTKFEVMGHARHYITFIQNTAAFVPNLAEQCKISDFSSKLDKLISLHQSKFEKLQKIKKSCLQNLFPQNNQNTPKIRFKNFSDEWVENKLEKIANRFDNLRIPISADKRISGSIPYYGANGIQDYVKGYTHNGEFILIAEDGANDLKNYPVQYVNGKFWANNHTHVVQAIKEIANNKFLKYVISQINIERILVGGGRAKLNANAMMDLCFNIPNLTEQEKIGAFFSKLDKLISLQQHKVEKLKNIKKALLNKMFI